MTGFAFLTLGLGSFTARERGVVVRGEVSSSGGGMAARAEASVGTGGGAVEASTEVAGMVDGGAGTIEEVGLALVAGA